jgi:hypothetical protein
MLIEKMQRKSRQTAEQDWMESHGKRPTQNAAPVP